MLINQSLTAIDAFHSCGFNTQVAQPQQRKLLDAMNEALSFGWPDDFTIGELADLTGMDKSAVSARRNAMLAAGMIERGPERECSISGRVCETVMIKRDLLGVAA